jgi:hypothetical protein
VPGFNIVKNTQGPTAKLEMARQHRWRFATIEPLNDILIYAHKSGRPKVEFDRATLHYQQDCIYFPGKQKWMPINITFYHIIDNVDSSIKIYEWWTQSVINITNSVISLKKQTCTLEMLDGSGSAVYLYTMYGCWPSRITPDDLDYSDTNISEVIFTLEMDKATEETLGYKSPTPLTSQQSKY